MIWVNLKCVVMGAAVLMVLGVSARAGVLIADSVAEFSNTQGLNGWNYGYAKINTGDVYHATPGGDDFQPFTVYALNANHVNENAWQFSGNGAPWTLLSADKAHPNGNDQWSGNGTNNHWAVRRYVTEVAGDLQIDWHLAKFNTGGGNGVTGRVYVNGAQVDSALIAHDDSTGVTKSKTVLAVPQGSFVDTCLDYTGDFAVIYVGGGGIGNGQFDLSVMTATVTLVPEPGTLTLAIGFGLALLVGRRK